MQLTLFYPNLDTILDYDRDLLLAKFDIYQQNLNKTDPVVVLKELADVLIKIFKTLDMDLGNIRLETEEQKEERLKIRAARAEAKEEAEVREDTQAKEEKAKADAKEIEEITQLFEQTGKPAPKKLAVKFETTGKSIIARMKKFHNFIKGELIDEVASHFDEPSLFDISVGRGGDLFKWDKANIDPVYGIDPDEESIKEAMNRYTKAKATNPPGIKRTRDYEFRVDNITDPNIVIPGTYDIVSCQFTLHYFFKTDIILETIITNVSKSLRSGGFFIGTTLIGDRVKKLARNNPFPQQVQIEILNPKSYKMKILDLKQSGTYGTSDEAPKDLIEYFVDFDKFIKMCAVHGLKLKERVPFLEMYKGYKKTLKTEYGCSKCDFENKKIENVERHIAKSPKCKNAKVIEIDPKLKDYELAITELNDRFIFQKT